MPRKSFNNKIYEYHNYFIDLNANHFGMNTDLLKNFMIKLKKKQRRQVEVEILKELGKHLIEK